MASWRETTSKPKGEIAALGETLNNMTKTLSSWRSRSPAWRARWAWKASWAPSRGAGSGGHLEDLTDNVNLLANNLTAQGAQHRRGDDAGRQRRPLPQDQRRREGRGSGAEEHHQHHGRSAPLLRRRGDRVAKEVGTDGKLGGQADVKGVSRHLKDLTTT